MDFFKLKENKTSLRTEIVAGITTFMTMAYIIFVNPGILSEAGMPWEGVFMATIFGQSWAPSVWPFSPTTRLPWPRDGS